MAGHDINYIALSGALSLLGRTGERPQAPINLLGDFAGGGMLCALGITLALLERSHSGKGQVVDAAMVDGAAYLSTFIYKFRNAGMWRDERGTNMLDGAAPFYDTYRTKDGQYMSVGAIEPQFYAALLQGLGLDAATMPQQMDQSKWRETAARFSEIFAGKTRDEWCAIFDGTDACVAPVLALGEADTHPHNRARRLLIADRAGQARAGPGPAPVAHAGRRHPAAAARSARTRAPSSASSASRRRRSSVSRSRRRRVARRAERAPPWSAAARCRRGERGGEAAAGRRLSRRSSTSTLPRLMAANDTPNRALAEIKELIDAGRPLIYLQSAEEERVQQLLLDAAQHLFSPPVPVFTWTATEGLRGPDGASVGETTVDPRAALDWIIDHEQPALFNLRDFHDAMRHSAEVRRRLRDLYTRVLRHQEVHLHLVAGGPHSRRAAARHRAGRSAAARLRGAARVHRARGHGARAAGVSVDADPGTLTQLGRAVQGLTLNETRHALRRALAATQRLDASSLPYLLEEKHLLVKKKTGVIEYIADPGGLENVGGAPLLKKWLLERRKLFEMRDQISHDIVPKGLLMMGISGCGKSLAVKAIAQCFSCRSTAST